MSKKAKEQKADEQMVKGPDAQALADVKSRYFAWLVKRETNRLQYSKRGHWIGKGVASTQA